MQQVSKRKLEKINKQINKNSMTKSIGLMPALIQIGRT